MAFLDPGSDPQAPVSIWLQSLIAVGSGEFTGVGFDGEQAKLFLSSGSAHRFLFTR